MLQIVNFLLKDGNKEKRIEAFYLRSEKNRRLVVGTFYALSLFIRHRNVIIEIEMK